MKLMQCHAHDYVTRQNNLGYLIGLVCAGLPEYVGVALVPGDG
jgi:hypothetical protein